MPEDIRKTDLVVIGAGPGGYAAAFAAADRGMKVTLIDADERLGGVCLLRGCIPSKALLHIARLLGEAKDAADWGIHFGPPKIDLDAVRRFKEQVVAKNANGIKQLAKSRKVEVIRAWARFADSQTLILSGQNGGEPTSRLQFNNAILAVGSRPAVVPSLAIKSDRLLDSTSALDLPDIPKSLLVIGGGYIGLELSTVYAALGSEVTVVEFLDGLLPGADRDLVRVLQVRLKNTIKNIHLSTKVVALEDVGNGIKATFDKARPDPAAPAPPPEQVFDRVLLSVGRTPNSEGLGLEHTNVKVNLKGFVEVDESRRTGDEHIYAIGDIAGEPMLAHKASHEARVAVEAIAGEDVAFEPRAIPAVVFTDPEIAWAGLTEAQAEKSNTPIQVAKFPWGASGRATAMARNDGLTKVIVDPETKRVLGVGIAGVSAGEMISEAVLAIEMGAVAQDLAMTIHPHPTLSETVMESAELAFGTTTHLFRPPR
jgi:dihydrolipoamide dehydrogenase